MKRLIWIALLLLPMAAKAQTHQVALSWTASVTQPTDGYRVYRAACNTPQSKKVASVQGGVCTNGGFQMLTTLSSSTTNFTDSAVQSGVSYEYYVTAFATADTPPESVPSVTLLVTVAPFGVTGPITGVGH